MGAANRARIEIHRAGEAVHLISAESPPDEQVSCDPVAAPWIIVDCNISNVDIRITEAIRGLIPDGPSAHVQRFFFGHPPAVTKSAPIARPIVRRPESRVIAISAVALKTAGELRTTSPKQVEGVTFRAAIGILKLHNGRATIIPWIANQCLPASAIDACKAKIRGIGGHGTRALEAPPLWRLPVQVLQCGAIAADLDLSGAVDHHFQRAFTVRCIAATGYRGLTGLCVCESSRYG